MRESLSNNRVSNDRVSSNRDLVQRAAAFVADQSASREVMIVGPCRGAVDDVARLACRRALAGVYRYTFRDAVYALSEQSMYARDLVPLRRAAREAVAASLSRKVKLEYLRDAAAFPGFARALARTLGDLRLNRISPAQVRLAGRSGPD
ncbi:MAG: hypothetical protein ACRD7E_05755, partial [Bryobacteraceae bacterium]